MLKVSARYKINRYVKFLLAFIGIIGIAGLGIQIWLVNNSKEILKTIVAERSEGKIKLELSKVTFNFFKNRLQIRQGELSSSDTAGSQSAYHVKFNKLTLKVRSFWMLLLTKQLNIDSININSPLIKVVQLRQDTAVKAHGDLSVTQEMGKVYTSMLDVLKNFGIRRIVVDNGSLKLVNNMIADAKPVFISNIHLNVLRHPDADDETIREQEEVSLTSNHQSINFSDGRHHLSFKNFKLQLFQKKVELDSCTISAVPKGEARSTYNIFFKKLLLVGVDFAAMGNLNLVRADTVFCENPNFDFKLNPVDADKKSNPDPKKLIKDLTSDLDLAYIGVKNAGIHFEIIGKKPRSFFNSNKDNFEIHGLKIYSDSASPVSVDRFNMVVRDYHLYNVDSSAIFSFDSIHFNNSKILLNNFTVLTAPSRYKIKSLRDFRFPVFELTGLNWYQLIFNQTVVAREAVLKNPVINYTKRTPPKEDKTSFFTTLQNMDSLMTLDKLSIFNGELNLNFGKSTKLNLYGVNVSLSSNKLLSATNQESVRKAVDYFSMTKGILQRNDLTGQLLNVKYLPNNIIYADKLLLKSASDNVNADISKVLLDNMLIDDRTESIYANGIQWESANVQLNTLPKRKSERKKMEGSFDVHNIHGNNTRLSLANGITNINSSVAVMQVDSLTKNNSGAARAVGIRFTGNHLEIVNDSKIIDAEIQDIGVDVMLIADEARNIAANGVRWNDAVVDIRSLVKKIKIRENSSRLSIQNINGTNTQVNMTTEPDHISTFVDNISAQSIEKIGNNPFVSKELFTNGRDLQVKSADVKASIQNYQLKDKKPSYLSNILYSKTGDTDTTSVQSARVNFSADINSILANTYKILEAEIIKPKVVISRGEEEAVIKASKKPGNTKITIGNLSVTSPDVTYSTQKKSSPLSLHIPATKGSLLSASNVIIDSNQIEFKSLDLKFNSVDFKTNKGLAFDVSNGKIDLSLSDVAVKKDTGTMQWQALINTLGLSNPGILPIGSGQNKLVVDSLKIARILLSSKNIKNFGALLSANPDASFQSGVVKYSDSNNTYKLYNAAYNNQLKRLSIDSFHLHPLLSQDSAVAKSLYQTDYIIFNTGPISFYGFDLEKYNKTQSMEADSVLITKPHITVFRDKFPPPQPYSLKLLPTAAIKKIVDDLFIKSIRINDGRVEYTEKHNKSRVEGTFLLTDINGTINNIINRSIKPNDSLMIDLDANVMNEAVINLMVNESYADTAHGFAMQLKMKPTPLNILNTVMVPLSNVKFTSGVIDSFYLNAAAREYFAVGKINMFYNNLRIKLIKDGNPEKSGIKNTVMTFLANTFIVKNKNTHRQAVLYFDRLRNKSFFNYMIKIVINGIATSVGANKSSKNHRKYKKELEHRGLPPGLLDSYLE